VSDSINELPEGWIETSLGQLTEPSKEKVDPTSLKEESNYIGLEHIKSNAGSILGYGISSDVCSSKSIFKKGDLLYGKLRPYLNKVYLAEIDGIYSTDIMVFPKSETILNQYAKYRFLSNDFVQYANANSTGVQHPRVKFESLAEFPILLPPLNEQQRIVSTIEQLTDRSHKARAALEDVPKLIAQFRQSVLAAAFRGDLTADWREKNLDIEPASELLERIKIDRLRHAKSPKQIEKINEIYSYEESEGTDALPAHWQYISLEKLANSLDYGTSAKSSSSGDVVVLRMGNLQGGEIDWGDLAYTSDKDEIAKYRLQPNTVLFNRTNSPELVGKTSIYRGDSPAIFAGYLIRIRNVEELDPEYLNYCLNSDYARGYCWKIKTDGVSQSNINAQKLGKFEIPFCSLKEQREIIGQIKRSFKTIKEIENLYQENYSDLERLDRSILAKAFRGELVPQDPNDEPAAALLDRIRAEREQTSSNKQRGKTTRKNSSKQLSIDGIE
jgi:type I restriction enzyme, S subunit